jgi:hypothetical protein
VIISNQYFYPRLSRSAGAALSTWNFFLTVLVTYTANDTGRSADPHLAGVKASHGGEARSTQCTTRASDKGEGFEILTEEKLQTLIEAMMAQLQPAVPAAS